MSSRSRLAVLLTLFSIVFVLVGCGSGGSAPKFALPPTGSFSNANLSGMYAFSLSGTNQAGFLALAGSFQADGNGNITSGVEDVNSGTGVFTNVPISGTYSVSADGRGLATLNSAVGTFTIDFVIVSSNRALAVRLDANSSASGSFDKQDPTAFSTSALTGQYAFSLSGIAGNGGTYQSAGLFTTDGASSLSNGLQDTNNDGVLTSDAVLTGTYGVSGSNGRGTMSLNSSAGTLNLAVYVVDATHFKLVETDTVPVLAGDAYRQTGTFANAALSGPFAFTVGGGLTGPFVAGGVFVADANGSITSGAEDLNNFGNVTQNVSTTGTYSIASTGRGTMTLTNSAGTFSYAVYPTTGGLLMLEMDSSLPSSGIALAQSGTPSTAAISDDYGFVLTGASASGEVDMTARLVGDGNGNFTGAADFNLTGNLSRSLAFNGTYSVGSNGRGTATLKSSNGTQNFAVYFVSNSQVLFVEIDSALTAVGVFEAQH